MSRSILIGGFFIPMTAAIQRQRGQTLGRYTLSRTRSRTLFAPCDHELNTGNNLKDPLITHSQDSQMATAPPSFY